MTFYYKSETEVVQMQPPETPGAPHPEHPIVLPPEAQPPLIIWGPNDPRPSVPIAEPPGGWGGRPPETEPIPPTIWGPNDPRPTPPIAEPPWGWGGKPELPDAAPGWKPVAAWTPATGWIVIAVPTGPVPTPSKRK